jgi:redox-sensitive bicupin YhaK (pirin superfamily)
MLQKVAFEHLGGADHGWLQARHHFSFARYYNPERMGFGLLRVVNDDIVAPHTGFDTHPHRDMEIITYVRSGAISHRDSEGNEGRTAAGDVQVMSAGSGVFHSEYNHEDEPVNLYQIWIIPDKSGVQPRWESRAFPKEPVTQLIPLVSGRSEDLAAGALMMHQDATIYGGRLRAATAITQPLKHQAYLLVSEGAVRLSDGTELTKGDAAEVTDVAQLQLEALSDAELLVIDVPATYIH